MEFKKILLPVDLSGISKKIVPYVQMMVEQHQAELHVLYVIDNFAGYTGLAEAHVDLGKLFADMSATAKEELGELVTENFPGLKGTVIAVAQGGPARTIRAYAKENGMDLIIMASHARHGLESMVMGSVARKVARDSEIPVLLINPAKG